MQADMANRPDGARRHHIAQPVIEQAVEGRYRLKGILAHSHRRGARVVLLAFKGHLHIADADDIGDDTDLLATVIQRRTLFDV